MENVQNSESDNQNSQQKKKFLLAGLAVLLGISFIANIVQTVFLLTPPSPEVAELTVQVQEDSTPQVKDEREVAQTPTIKPSYSTRNREIVSSAIRIGESEGNLGETYISQNLLNNFISNPSCETLIDAKNGEYSLPWILDNSTKCDVVQDGSNIYVSIVGLAWVYEGLPIFSDGIIYFKGMQPYLFTGIHPYLGAWKSQAILTPLQEEYPNSEFASDGYRTFYDKYVDSMNAYLDEENGEMTWAQEELKTIIDLYLIR
jgi:hypothetical protein